MACKFLSAHQDGAGNLVYRVWLDDTQGTADAPADAYVRTWTFVPQPSGWTAAALNGTTYSTYADYVTAEVKLLATAEADRMAADADPTDLGVAGATF